MEPSAFCLACREGVSVLLQLFTFEISPWWATAALGLKLGTWESITDSNLFSSVFPAVMEKIKSFPTRVSADLTNRSNSRSLTVLLMKHQGSALAVQGSQSTFNSRFFTLSSVTDRQTDAGHLADLPRIVQLIKWGFSFCQLCALTSFQLPA